MKSDELRAIFGAMMSAPWTLDNNGDIWSSSGPTPYLHWKVCQMYTRSHQENGTAIVALANHADAFRGLAYAVERYLRGCDIEHPDLMAITMDDLRAALARVHEIGRAP